MQMFNLPDLGEGLSESTIVQWHVKKDEIVEIDQILVTLENAKSTIDIPSPFKGRVVKLFGKNEEIIQTGSPLIGYEELSVLKNLVEKQKKIDEKKFSDKSGIVGCLSSEKDLIIEHENKDDKTIKTRISPKARTLARQLKIPSRNFPKFNRCIVEKDIIELKENQKSFPTETPIAGIRLAMAQNMQKSQEEVLPVTCAHEACIDHWNEREDLTVKVIQSISHACRVEPIINYYFNKKALSFSANSHINIGLAMDTPHGLYAPVIHNAETLSKNEIRSKINVLKQKGKEKKLLKEDLQNPTILLSNFGPLGTTFATMAVVPPMVAIVGIGKTQKKIVLENNIPKEKNFLPVILTVNHFFITGGEASRFLKALIQKLETKIDLRK